MKDFKDQFPVTGQYTYLNTASCGLLSKSLVEWRHEQDENLLHGGSMFRDLHKAHIREIRRSVGHFFFTSEENVALVPNFSFGMNTVLDGIPKGQKILLLNRDYPSINWPVENRDFEICYAEIDEHLEQNIEVAVERYQPDVFAFSIVQYISGILIDLDFLKRLKQKYPDLLLITDATQFLGTTNFNFEENAIDVMGVSSYKWMLAGYGNGFFLIKQDAQQKISPITIGLNSADASFSKTKEIEFGRRSRNGDEIQAIQQREKEQAGRAVHERWHVDHREVKVSPHLREKQTQPMVGKEVQAPFTRGVFQEAGVRHGAVGVTDELTLPLREQVRIGRQGEDAGHDLETLLVEGTIDPRDAAMDALTQGAGEKQGGQARALASAGTRERDHRAAVRLAAADGGRDDRVTEPRDLAHELGVRGGVLQESEERSL